MLTREDLIQVLAAQQWEKCKGELNALVAIVGSSNGGPNVDIRNFFELKVLIDNFIVEMEANKYYR